MQMVKHIADPMRPIMVSKLGINIASNVIVMISIVRIEPFNSLRVQAEQNEK